MSLAAMPDGSGGSLQTPLGVVILSQTCDLIQLKDYCTIAPLQLAKEDAVSRARRGQNPLVLHLPANDESPNQIANLERMAAVPKKSLVGARLTDRRVTHEQSRVARNLAARIARVFGRFPFPDSVHDACAKLQEKARKTGAESAFGRLLEHVLELRVTTQDWTASTPDLTLHIVVQNRLLIKREDADEEWAWDAAAAKAKKGEQLATMTLTRLSEVLLVNIDAMIADPRGINPTTVLQLWIAWTDALQRDLLSPAVDRGLVASFTPNLLSDREFTLEDMNSSESLDLETLSDSNTPR